MSLTVFGFLDTVATSPRGDTTAYPIFLVHPGTGGLLLLRAFEDSGGGHNRRAVNGKRSSSGRGAKYHEGVRILSDGAGTTFYNLHSIVYVRPEHGDSCVLLLRVPAC